MNAPAPAKSLRKLVRVENGRGTHKDLELVGFVDAHTAQLFWPGAGHYDLDLITGKLVVTQRGLTHFEWSVSPSELEQLRETNRRERGL